MAVIRLSVPPDPNALSWEEAAALGLDAVPSEHAAEIALAKGETVVMGDDAPLIVRLDSRGEVISSRPYQSRQSAAMLPLPRRH